MFIMMSLEGRKGQAEAVLPSKYGIYLVLAIVLLIILMVILGRRLLPFLRGAG